MAHHAEMELKKQIQKNLRAVSSIGQHAKPAAKDNSSEAIGVSLIKPNMPAPSTTAATHRTTADTVAKKISAADVFGGGDVVQLKPKKVQFDGVTEEKSKATLKPTADVLMESFNAELFQKSGNAAKVSLKDAGGHRSSLEEPQHQEILAKSSHSAGPSRNRAEDKSAQLCKCKSCTLRRDGAIQDVPKVVPAESMERRFSRSKAEPTGQRGQTKSAKIHQPPKVGVKINNVKLHTGGPSKGLAEPRNKSVVPDILLDIRKPGANANSTSVARKKENKVETNSPGVAYRNSRPYVPTVAENHKTNSPAPVRNAKPIQTARKTDEENVNWSFVALNFVQIGETPADPVVDFLPMRETEGAKEETCCNSFYFVEMPTDLQDLTIKHSQVDQIAVRPSTNQPGTVQWKKGPLLGRGAFGTVWCGLTATGELIAVKQAEITDIDIDKAEKEYKKIQEEVALLKCLNHINIVGYLGTCLAGNTVSIFMQYVPGGSIAGILKKFGSLNEEIVSKYTKQLLEGVQYIHAKDVIHRDIKGSNIMVMPNAVIKLIDFGCAKRILNLTKSNTEVLKSMKGTPFWMAPEVLNETGHGKKSDIWSVGCTVYEMVTATPPFSYMPKWTAIYAIASGSEAVKLPPASSDIAKDFVSCCLQRDISLRPTADELLSHNFISFYSQTSRRIQDSRGNPLNITNPRKT